MFPLPSITALSGLIAVAAPFVVYAVMTVQSAFDVRAAVASERNRQETACSARVSDIGRQHNEAVARAAEEARQAAEAVGRTPETVAELTALCQKSASCRSRGTQP